MLVAQQLGESANDLVKKWGTRGYRYGFPDFYAAEFPVRPMDYDQSRIYSGVIGRQYPDAQTGRYHYMFDPNVYQQPGVPSGLGDTASLPSVDINLSTDEGARASAFETANSGSLVTAFVAQQPTGPVLRLAAHPSGAVVQKQPLLMYLVGGATVVAAGIVGGLVGNAIGKRRALRNR